MSSTGERVAILYVTDANYHGLTEISVASMMAMHETQLDFHVAQFQYELALSAELTRDADARGHRLFQRVIEPQAEQFVSTDSLRLFSHITSTSLHKGQAIDELTKSYEWVVYIDPDIVAFRQFDVHDQIESIKQMGAVYDFVTYMDYDGQNVEESALASGYSGDYFNSGLMVVSSVAWRSLNLFERYLKALVEHDQRCPYRRNPDGKFDTDCRNTDQCAFNMAYNGSWTPLPFTWNAQKPVRHTSVWANAILRHYTGKDKITVRSNRSRDWREVRLLRKLLKAGSLPFLRLSHYDAGLAFFADAFRYRALTRRYRQLLTRLEKRRSARLGVDSSSKNALW